MSERLRERFDGETDPAAAAHVLLTVIVPVGPGDTTWQSLRDTWSPPVPCQLILSATTPPALTDWPRIELVEPPTSASGGHEPPDSPERLAASSHTLHQLPNAPFPATEVYWLTGPRGRAKQLNAATRCAQAPILWYLHADSTLSAAVWTAIATHLETAQRGLVYFDLAFRPDGPRATRLNANGAWFRSHWLGLPFGDQGFLIARHLVDQLEGFDERAPYGEDHLFVWAAHRLGIPLVPTNVPLLTSARKYARHGWCATTLRHLWLTVRQAFPQWCQLWRERLSHRGERGQSCPR